MPIKNIKWVQAPEEKENETAKRAAEAAARGSTGVLPTLTRVGSGLFGVTPVTGAASGAIGEALAQMIEKGTVNPAKLNYKRIGAEAGVGMVGGGVLRLLTKAGKAGKAGLATLQGSLIGSAAPIVRKGLEEGELPTPGEIALGTIIGGGAGYGTSKLLSRLLKGRLGGSRMEGEGVPPVAEKAKAPENPFKGEKGLEHAFKLVKDAKSGARATSEVVAAQNALDAEVIKHPLGKTAKRLELLREVEESQGIATNIVKGEAVSTEKAANAALKEKVDVAKAQEAAAKLVGKEKIDAEKAQVKLVEEEAKREAANLNARDKYVRGVAGAKEAALVEDAKRTAADIARREAIRQEAELQRLDETLTEEKKPTAIYETVTGKGEYGGKRKATFRKVAPEPEEGADISSLGPKAGGLIPAQLPALDPQVVSVTAFKTRQAALEALGRTGRRGRVESIGKGTHKVVFDEQVGTPSAPITPPAKIVGGKAASRVFRTWAEARGFAKRVGGTLERQKDGTFKVNYKKPGGEEPPTGGGGAPPGGAPRPPRKPVGPTSSPAKGKVAGLPKVPAEVKPEVPRGTSETQSDYERTVAESGLPEGAIKLDLTGARNAAEVRNRVVNELQKYKAQVDAAEVARGVNEKGEYTYPVPVPEPVTIHVPGGPTFRVGPGQVAGAIERLEKGLTRKGYQGMGTPTVIKPETAFQGIVDKVKPPTSVRIPAEPPYTLPVEPLKPTIAGEAAPKSIDKMLADDVAAWDNYFRLKDLEKAGQATHEEVRAAGRAAGEIRKAFNMAAEASKAAGEELPIQVRARIAPETVNSDEISKLSTEEQKQLLKVLGRKYGKGKGFTAGAFGGGMLEDITRIIEENPEYFAKTVGTIGGALGGALLNEEDPLEGAIIGGGLGLGAGTLAGKQLPKLMAGQTIKEFMEPVTIRVPNYFRANLLSHPLNMTYNSLAGPWGSNVFGGTELFLKGKMTGDVEKQLQGIEAIRAAGNIPKWLRDYWTIGRPEAIERIHSTEELGRAGEFIDFDNPNILDRVTSLPAIFMLAGDLNVRRILEAAGVPEALAREITLTSEPARAITKGIVDFVRAKGGSSVWAKAMLPFSRTAANILESGVERTPIIGHILNEMGDPALKISRSEEAVQQALGVVAWGLGFAVGISASPDTAKQYKLGNLVSNLGGQYSLLTSTGYLAGQGYRMGKTTEEAAWDSFKRTYTSTRGEMPLPTVDPFYDLAKKVEKLATGDYEGPREVLPDLAVPRLVDFILDDIPKLVGPKRRGF